MHLCCRLIVENELTNAIGGIAVEQQRKHSKRSKKTSYRSKIPESCQERLLSGFQREGPSVESGIEMQR